MIRRGMKAAKTRPAAECISGSVAPTFMVMMTGWLLSSTRSIGVQNAIASLSAHRYWSGAPSDTPRWEILLAPPVRVMEHIP